MATPINPTIDQAGRQGRPLGDTGRPAQGSVLVVTAKFDPHADGVIAELKRRDVPVFRLNTDDFLNEYSVSVEANGDLCIRDRWGRSLDFPAGTRSAWYRKPVDPAPPAGADAGAAALVLGETRAFLDGLAADPRARWVNHPHMIARARHKLPQLRLAQSLGLIVPRTLVTNDPDRARAFHASAGGDLIVKALRETGYAEGADWRSLFTRRLPPAEFAAAADAIARCPTLLQAYVAKDHELRVTIIGDAVFCCRIDSQQVSGAESDWRRADPAKVPHRMVPLDPAVERALRAMLDQYGLVFGAFDLIVTAAGDPVFLELNPNGQWLWIERATGAPLSAAMADLLAG